LKAVDEFKNPNSNLRFNFYSILPFKSDNELIQKHLVEPFLEEYKIRDIVLTSEDEWKKPSETVWAAKIIQEISDRLERGEPLHLRLCLPGCDEPIQANATTVWQRSDDGTPASVSGHEFIELSTDDRDRLQRAIEQLAASSS
jgi:hypothetical protein